MTTTPTMKDLTYCQVRRYGKVAIYLIPTVFIDDMPSLIFYDEIDPALKHFVPLDPALFSRNGGTSTADAHSYEVAVDDPRKSH